MTKPSEIGFSKDTIAEIILSTYNPDGKPNAAPMGATLQTENQLALTLYNSSQTLKNLQTTKCAVLNVTFDIDLFYKTAFKEANPNSTLPQEWFSKAETVDAPKLKAAEATIEVTVAELKSIDAERIQTTCCVTHINAQKTLPIAPNRAFSAALEAIIHATRIKVFLQNSRGNKAQTQNLFQSIDICRNVVYHAAPNSHYAEVMADLIQLIDSWRKPPA